MAKTHLRGVNDIPNRMNQPRGLSERSQNATALARLEQQKTLLEKQLQVWVKQKLVTEERLRIVAAQIRTVNQALRQPRAAAPAPSSRKASALQKTAPRASRAQAIEFSF